MYDHVVSGLIRRRRELTGDMLELLAQVDALAADIEALDKVLRQFEIPVIQLTAIPALQNRPKPDWAAKGEVVRIIFAILREAREPLSTREIAAEVHRRRGLEGEITVLQVKRVRKCLERQRACGTIRGILMHGVLHWQVTAPDDQLEVD